MYRYHLFDRVDRLRSGSVGVLKLYDQSCIASIEIGRIKVGAGRIPTPTNSNWYTLLWELLNMHPPHVFKEKKENKIKWVAVGCYSKKIFFFLTTSRSNQRMKRRNVFAFAGWFSVITGSIPSQKVQKKYNMRSLKQIAIAIRDSFSKNPSTCFEALKKKPKYNLKFWFLA